MSLAATRALVAGRLATALDRLALAAEYGGLDVAELHGGHRQP